MSDPMIFTVTTEAPGPADFVFDDIGFGPISGSLVVNEELLGIPLPLIDAGVTFDYTVGARLVLSVDFGKPTVQVNYGISEGDLVNQSSMIAFSGNPDRLARIESVAHYRSRAITFDTNAISFVDTGNPLAVTPSQLGARISLDLDYQLKLVLANAFIELGFPFYEGTSADLGLELFNFSGPENLFLVKEGDLGEEINDPTDPFNGTFIKAPISPRYEDQSNYTVNGLANNLTSVSLYDTGDPFARLQIDFAKILADLGAPIGKSFELPFGSASVNLLKALGTIDVAIGQSETFRADDVHVKLELLNFDGVSTGKFVEGRLGDQLLFDSLTFINENDVDLGFGKIKATYTLYGALEQQTGLDVSGSLELGLLTGSVHVDVFGFSANGGFGPLIPLPTLSFSTGLIPLVSDSKPLTFGSIERVYDVYSELDPEGSDASDNLTLISDTSLDTLGGDDVIKATNDVSHRIDGGAGNDQIFGSFFKTGPSDVGDTLIGGTGDDLLVGGTADDLLIAGNGADHLIGDDGDDYLLTNGTDGADILEGGDGFDTAFIDRQGSTLNWSDSLKGLTLFGGTLTDGTQVSGIEQWQLMLGFGNDTVLGSDNDDIINGGAGDDSLNGLEGADRLRGEGGNDTLHWWSQPAVGTPDQVSGGVGLDTIDILVDSALDVAFNLSGNAFFLPNAQGGIGIWSDLSPSIDGVKLDSDSGDFLPLLLGDFDSFTTSAMIDYVTAPAELSLKVRTDIERLDFAQTGTGRVFVTGGFLADTIFAGDGDDRLDGLLGEDEIFAGDGNDLVINWDADLILNGGAGLDTLAVIRSGETARSLVLDFAATNADGLGETSDGAVFANFEILNVEGSQHADIIWGGAAADIIYGNGGADTLAGRGGGDQIDGGEGDDTITAAEGLGTGANAYVGGQGMDTLYLVWEVGQIIAGPGPFDLRFESDPLNIDLRSSSPHDLGNGSTVTGFERLVVTGGNAGDIISGGAGFVETPGRKGEVIRIGDVIDGGAGNDQITAVGQYDVISGGDGDDVVLFDYGASHKLDGGAGYDTLVIRIPFSLDQNKILSKLKTFTYNTTEDNPDTGRTVSVKEFKLPDGTVFANFERIVFDVETVTDVVRQAGSDLDDEVIVGRGGTVNGGKGNDFIRAFVSEPSPIFDRFGPIAAIKGGDGEDYIRGNVKGTFNGGDGFDRGEFDFSSLTEKIVGKFKRSGMSLSGEDGAKLARTIGIEESQLFLGSGNDDGQFEDGAFAVDFGAGFDSAAIDHGAGIFGKNYGFGGGVAPTFRFVTGEADRGFVIPIARGFTDGTGLDLSNFEALELEAGSGEDVIDLTFAPETLTLVRVDAGAGDDIVLGSLADDTILGGDGDDVMTGNGGGDRFVFNASALGDFDAITDFDANMGDIIDLAAIDANAARRGNQSFSYIGEGRFTSAAGQLRFVSGPDGIVLEGDVDGDGVADFSIELTGLFELEPDALIL